MPRFRLRRAFGLGSLLATVVACVGASPALASPEINSGTFPIAFVCQSPLTDPGPQPGLLVTQYSYRAWPAAGGFPTSGVFKASLPDLTELLDALQVADASVEGTWRWHVTGPDGANYTEDAPIAASSIRQAGGPVAPTTSGTARPPVGELSVGSYALSLDALTLRVRGTDSSGNPVDFDFGTADGSNATPLTITCTGARAGIANIETVAPTQPPAFGPITVTDTSATVQFVGGYGTFRVNFSLDGQPVKSVDLPNPGNPQGTVTLEGLSPNTTYTLTASGIAYNTGQSKPSAPKQFTTLSPAKQSVALSGPAALALRSPQLAGTATGTSTVSGELTPATGAFNGLVSLGPATASLKAFGAFPVKARLTFKGVGASTGTVGSGGASLRTTQDVAISGVTLAGLSIATGTCHTAVPPTFTLSGPAATLTAGGTATASFTLGRLTGCSTFGSFFGTTGGTAALSVRLAPTPAPAGA